MLVTTSPFDLAGIPNTLNVISNIPFFFVGVTGLILCHYKDYFRLRCSTEALYTVLFTVLSLVET